MKTTMRILSLLLCICALLTLSSCGSRTAVPAEAEAVVERYYDEHLKAADEIDPAVIEECMHWNSDEERELTLANLYQILDYQIAEAERIGDDLCVFRVLVRDEGMPAEELQKGTYQEFYMFSVRLGGQWYICGQRNIPEDIAEGCDLSAYGSGTIVGAIGEVEVIEPEYVLPD